MGKTTEKETVLAERIEELEAEVKGLRDLSNSKDEFIRITNHELRTPLDAIRGNLDMVLKGEAGEIPQQTREYLADSLSGADRLVKIVNDMLDISRIESGRMRFTLEDVDLAELLKTIVNEFTHAAKEKQVHLHLDIPAELAHAFSDRARLFQIIDNLLGNALKFTLSGGSITLKADAEPDSIVISIEDTGIGLKPEDKEKLFKRFPDIDTSLAGNVKGTGIGLSLVWQLVEKLGGEISVKSPGPGKGSTFSFRIPRVGNARAEALKRFHSRFLGSDGEPLRPVDKTDVKGI